MPQSAGCENFGAPREGQLTGAPGPIQKQTARNLNRALAVLPMQAELAHQHAELPRAFSTHSGSLCLSLAQLADLGFSTLHSRCIMTF